MNTFNGSFTIAIGKSRNETSWANKDMDWPDFVKLLSKTHRTAETYKEYLAAKKDRQAEIKDVGGFVGGYLAGGRRKLASVLHRSIITYDIEGGTANIWEIFTMLYPYAAVIYSTHKHSPDNPRYRLIIPLSREVMSDEYIPIARRIAGNLGIDGFDPTCFQPHQLMYWPSTSKDGEYFFDSQDGPALDPDEILKTYRNWKDASEWPYSVVEDKKVRLQIKAQADPLTKKGLVGAFCRTYNVPEAIETFLSDIYELTDHDNRYTYREGSSAGGLVVYDDLFTYSHHGTDPSSGKTCNAYDLVRIHKFGMRDKGDSQTISNSAMDDLVQNDKKVSALIADENLQSGDFDGVEIDDEEEDLKWKDKLKLDKKGNFLSSINNIYLILKNDEHLKNTLYFDEFEGVLIVRRDLPWRKVTHMTRDFTDDDADCLCRYLEESKMPFSYIDKALANIRNKNRLHPVKEYLKDLVWDGQERLDTLFIDYLGAADNPYTRSATRKMFVAAVARIYEPGTKCDTMITLAGLEGVGKSTIVAKMAKRWFSDRLGDIHKTEGMESLRGIWIMEVAELSAFRKAEQQAIKRFISSTEDYYRPPYGKRPVRFPRQCVFFGTTENNDYISGSFGARRDLPIAVLAQAPTKSVFNDLPPTEVDQLWSEAIVRYRAGESIDLSEEIKEMAAKIREEHREVDERQGAIEEYLGTLLPVDWEEKGIHERRSYLAGDEFSTQGAIVREFVSVAEVWCEVLGGMQKDMGTQNTKYIHDILRKMKGWKPQKGLKRLKHYGHQRVYYRVNTEKSSVLTAVNTKNTNVNTN